MTVILSAQINGVGDTVHSDVSDLKPILKIPPPPPPRNNSKLPLPRVNRPTTPPPTPPRTTSLPVIAPKPDKNKIIFTQLKKKLESMEKEIWDLRKLVNDLEPNLV